MNKSVLSNRSLMTIGIAESVSNIGNWITMMAVYAMVVFKGSGSVAESSGIFLAGLLPTLIFSPVAGWLCDRFDRKLLMIVSELLSGLVVMGLIFTTRIEVMYALLALQAATMSVMSPARQSVVPDIVGHEALTQANAFLQQLAGIIKIAAPMLAGLILAVMNPHQAIILDVVSFALSALILSRLPALPPHRTEKTSLQGEPVNNRTSVWKMLKDSSGLRLLFTGMFLSIFIIIGFDVLSPILVRDALSGNEQFFGLMIGIVGCGTVLASIILMLMKRKRNLWIDMALGLAMLGMITWAVVAAMAVSEPMLARIVMLAGCLIGGFGHGLLLIQVSTLLQTLTPSAILGRIGGVFQGVMVAGQLGGLLITPLLVPGLLSMASYFTVSGVSLLVLALFVAISSQKLPSTGQSIEPAQEAV